MCAEGPSPGANALACAPGRDCEGSRLDDGAEGWVVAGSACRLVPREGGDVSARKEASAGGVVRKKKRRVIKDGVSV